MRYDNEQCQLCSGTFAPEDDVVVCPECGTPTHRACWAEHGGCPNAERHGEYNWKPSAQNKNENFDKNTTPGTICPRCGNNCAPEMLACPRCGMQLSSDNAGQGSSSRIMPDLSTEEGRTRFFMQGVDAESSDEIDGVRVGDIAAFVQSNAARIISKFKRISKDKKITWNWGAFIFAEFWFIYRKMFKIGVLMMAASLAISILRIGSTVEISRMTSGYVNEFSDAVTAAQEGKISNAELEARARVIYSEMQARLAENPSPLIQYAVLSALLFIKHIVSGLIGYWLYRRHVLEKIKAVKSTLVTEEMFIAHALRYEGVSVLLFAVSFFGSQMIIDFLTNYAL